MPMLRTRVYGVDDLVEPGQSLAKIGHFFSLLYEVWTEASAEMRKANHRHLTFD
jgi:hypothetical protein